MWCGVIYIVFWIIVWEVFGFIVEWLRICWWVCELMKSCFVLLCVVYVVYLGLCILFCVENLVCYGGYLLWGIVFVNYYYVYIWILLIFLDKYSLVIVICLGYVLCVVVGWMKWNVVKCLSDMWVVMFVELLVFRM